MPFLGKRAYIARHLLLLLHSGFSLPWPRIQNEKVNPWPGLSCVAVGDWGWFAWWWSAGWPIVTCVILGSHSDCVPLLVASRGSIQEEGIEFSTGLASEGSSLYLLCNITAVYVRFSFELQSCCVAQGNLKLLGSREPSCLILQSHQDIR